MEKVYFNFLALGRLIWVLCWSSCFIQSFNLPPLISGSFIKQTSLASFSKVFWSLDFAKVSPPKKNVIHTNSITRILGDVLIKGTTTPIAKAVITNVEMERTVIADLQGHFVMEKFLSGLAQYTVSAPGYHPLTVVIKTIRGESLTHNFELEPIV